MARTIFWPPGPLPLRSFSSISVSGGGFGRGGRLDAGLRSPKRTLLAVSKARALLLLRRREVGARFRTRRLIACLCFGGSYLPCFDSGKFVYSDGYLLRSGLEREREEPRDIGWDGIYAKYGGNGIGQ